MRGVPLFGTLLAVEEDGEIVGGRHERAGARASAGTRGAAAGRGRSARSVRGPGSRGGSVSHGSAAIADAQILYSSPFDIEASGAAPGFAALVRSAWRDRGFGDFWGYALVAEGAAEAMVEVGPNSWDLAAPSILVEEAGGRMTDIRGERRSTAGPPWRPTASSTTRSWRGFGGRTMTIETITAVLLIAVPIAFNLAFFELGRAFDYPNILRKEPDEILRRFDAGGSGLILRWEALLVSALLMLPLVGAARRRPGRRRRR